MAYGFLYPTRKLECCWDYSAVLAGWRRRKPLSNLTGERVEERRYRRARLGYTEGRVTTGKDPTARVEDIVAQRNVLTGDIGLVRAVAVVETDNAAVGGRSLRPLDPPA